MTQQITVSPTVRSIMDKANRAHTELLGLATATLNKAIAVGELLSQARAVTPHGQWEAVVASCFEGSSRSARKYMQLAEHKQTLTDQAKMAPGGHFGIKEATSFLAEVTAKQRLTSPSERQSVPLAPDAKLVSATPAEPHHDVTFQVSPDRVRIVIKKTESLRWAAEAPTRWILFLNACGYNRARIADVTDLPLSEVSPILSAPLVFVPTWADRSALVVQQASCSTVGYIAWQAEEAAKLLRTYGFNPAYGNFALNDIIAELEDTSASLKDAFADLTADFEKLVPDPSDHFIKNYSAIMQIKSQMLMGWPDMQKSVMVDGKPVSFPS